MKTAGRAALNFVLSASVALSTLAVADAKEKLLIRVEPNEPLVQPQSAVGTIGGAAAAAPMTPVPKAAPVASAKERHLQALELAIKGQTSAALAILKTLPDLEMSANERDRIYLTTGRVKYQVGDYNGALQAYQKMRKGGAGWLEMLEERSSVYMRLGQPQNALASLKTVLAPLFKERTLTEPYFLAALAQLRVCDYKSVFKTLELFKERFRDRVKQWESAKADPNAQIQLAEARETIQKLNLVEAEAIQRLYMDESGKPMAGSPPKIERSSDQLSFPSESDMDSKEIWLDEVDDYRATVKNCPTAGPAPDLVANGDSVKPNAKKANTL